MDDLLKEFLEESAERMARLDASLATLSNVPDDAGVLGDIHVLLRTIKGTSGFLKLPELESLAQAADAVVDRVRVGDIVLTPDVCSVIVAAIDRIKSVLAHLSANETEPGDDHGPLIDGLSHLAETGEALPEQPAGTDYLQDNTADAQGPVVAAPGPVQAKDEATSDAVGVKPAVLQNLLRMVSELVSTRNQLMDILRNKGDADIDASLQRLTDVTAGLRQGILQTQPEPIQPALLVECSGQRFALPQSEILEVVGAGAASAQITEGPGGATVLRSGDDLLPLVSLGEMLKLPEAGQDARSHCGPVLIAKNGTHRFGLVVDALLDTEDIAVQPVVSLIRSIPFFGGTTVLNDGTVAMVLEVEAFAPAAAERSPRDAAVFGHDPVAFLLFRCGGKTPMAVLLSTITRLEEIDFNDVDFGDTGMTVDYHGKTLPLIPVDNDIVLPGSGRKPVLVMGDDEGTLGLIVDEVCDIVDTRITLQSSTRRPGILGSAVLSGIVTDILDGDFYVNRIAVDRPDGTVPAVGNRSAVHRLLLVDDSAYIRNLLTPLLVGSGFEVIVAHTVAQALSLCGNDPAIDVIVCNIDPPDQSGFTLVETLRRDTRWADLPIIAVASQSDPDNLRKSHDSGFSDYIEKYNRDGLLQALSELL